MIYRFFSLILNEVKNKVILILNEVKNKVILILNEVKNKVILILNEVKNKVLAEGEVLILKHQRHYLYLKH